jgi:hypothetical protein
LAGAKFASLWFLFLKDGDPAPENGYKPLDIPKIVIFFDSREEAYAASQVY